MTLTLQQVQAAAMDLDERDQAKLLDWLTGEMAGEATADDPIAEKELNQELDRRHRECEANPDLLIPWEVALQELKDKHL